MIINILKKISKKKKNTYYVFILTDVIRRYLIFIYSFIDLLKKQSSCFEYVSWLMEKYKIELYKIEN